MTKIILVLVLLSSLAFGASLKANGCDLSQVGDVAFSVGSKTTKSANYKAIAASGKNFRSILVGSTMGIDGATLKIVDIKANKRVKREARTGVVSVSIDADGKTQKLDMTYRYNKGHFVAKGMMKNDKKVNFALDIKALLCHVN